MFQLHNVTMMDEDYISKLDAVKIRATIICGLMASGQYESMSDALVDCNRLYNLLREDPYGDGKVLGEE